MLNTRLYELTVYVFLQFHANISTKLGSAGAVNVCAFLSRILIILYYTFGAIGMSYNPPHDIRHIALSYASSVECL